jgi:hypothetical protein
MKCSILPFDQTAAVGADPQAAIAGGQQAKDTIFPEGRRIFMGKEWKRAPSKRSSPPLVPTHR